jgi:glycosyltransferase involved in cell wall biosynthesis
MQTLLQINVTANWGSTGKIAEQIGIRAKAHGWNVYMAYGRSMNPSKLALIKVGSKFNPYIHFAISRLFDREGLSSRKETKQLINRIKQIKPDIIHLHNIHDHWLNYQLLFEYINSTSIKVVWTFHDCWAFTGHCCHFTSIKCLKWQSQCDKCPMKSGFIDASKNNFQLKKSLFLNCKNLTIVPVSKWLEGETRKSFFTNSNIDTILNGVDTTMFHPIETDEIRDKYNLHGKFVLMAAATAWSNAKGLQDYIELSKRLPSDCVLMLVGLTPRQMKSMPNSILCLSRTANVTELAELYSTADIVMNLSYQETFGLTTAEGFACGTPTIVYNATASPELVTDQTGCIVELGNVDGVLDAILNIKSKGKNFYSASCRQRALDLYDKDKNYEKYISLYSELVTK